MTTPKQDLTVDELNDLDEDGPACIHMSDWNRLIAAARKGIGAQEVSPAQDRAASQEDTCPRCGSTAPHLHPAVQFEGEVQVCPDAFHSKLTNQNRPSPTPGDKDVDAFDPDLAGHVLGLMARSKQTPSGIVERLTKRCNCNPENPCMAEEDCTLDREAAEALKRMEQENERLYRAGQSLLKEISKANAEWKLWFQRFQEARVENQRLSLEVERLREVLGKAEALIELICPTGEETENVLTEIRNALAGGAEDVASQDSEPK